MDFDPDNLKKTAASLAYQSSIGIGVVFVALLTGLPAAWEIEELRRPFVLYFAAVGTSLLCAIVLLLFMTVRKEVSKWHRMVTANVCVAGLALFAFSSIAFACRLVELTR